MSAGNLNGKSLALASLNVGNTSVPLPSGLFSTVVGIGSQQWHIFQGYYQATLTYVSPYLTADSTLSCTLQIKNAGSAYIADQELHWLITAQPSSASGGSITFILSSTATIAYPENLFISWAVTKF